MIESPEAVKALADKVRRLMVAFFVEWFGRYGTTFVAHYPDYVMDRGITMSVDEVGAVSGDMIHEFFRPELIGMAEEFGCLGIHCRADARHQWENFRGIPGLKVMNHNAPPTRNVREYILDSLRHYGNTVAQVPVGWTPDGSPETWPSQFPGGTRVAFEVWCETQTQAVEIAKRLQTVRKTGV